MRPPGRDVFYRHTGHIHPKACSLRLHIELRRPSIEFDAYGMPLKDKSISYPSLFLSRLAVKKKDADLNVNSDFFTKGVSEEENDYAFVCGGAAENAFSYQTHTRGAWSNAYQFRDEDSLAFPSADGTVEAWFKPDWDKTDAGTNSVTVFEGYQGYTSLKKHKWRRTLLHLGYSPVSGKATFFISDWKGNEFRSEFPSVEIPDKVWTHIAVQWTPNEHANLFIAGKCIGQMPINGFEAVPLADLNEKNFSLELHAVRLKTKKMRLLFPRRSLHVLLICFVFQHLAVTKVNLFRRRNIVQTLKPAPCFHLTVVMTEFKAADSDLFPERFIPTREDIKDR